MASKKRESGKAGGRTPASPRTRSREEPRRRAVGSLVPRPRGKPSPVATWVPIIGIGASAGGLDALKKFFDAVPPRCGMAFVVIQHLDPTHKSDTANLLGLHTGMKVLETEDHARVEPDCVYVIPPNKSMAISRGELRLTEPEEPRGLRLPIDRFFRSLGEDQRERAIGVVLSGTGGDGTAGLSAIKAAGGTALVQDPETAQHAGMPRSAISTGLADEILPPEKMPQALLRIVRRPPADATPSRAPARGRKPGALGAILELIRAQTRYDFSHHKTGTLGRRIARRMGLRRIDRLEDYRKFLSANPEEVSLLSKDLLIGVTGFFRDREAWQALEQSVIRRLVAGKGEEGPIRVWVPGCATGEEPYSIAMLLSEQLRAARAMRSVQIFATDVDEHSLRVARNGAYPEAAVAAIPAHRLKRFFVKEKDRYRVVPELRDLVVFARQNILSDPPFSKMDLVICRNLLIYLDQDTQKKVIPLLHFALREGGALFLGNAETIGQQTDLFEVVSKRWRIYRRIGPTRHERVDFPVGARESPRVVVEAQPQAPPIRRRFSDLAQQLVMERCAPAGVLVNRKLEIQYSFGPTERYLSRPPGVMTTDLLAWAHEGLRTKLRGPLRDSIRTNERVIATGIRMKAGKEFSRVRVAIEPLQAPPEAEGLLFVTFQDEPAPQPAPVRENEDAADRSLVDNLEYELQSTKEELQRSIEDLETSNEELRVANEEVMSVNEELQSGNEELETSREELQSLNEELTTVNSQLQAKVEELEAANDDLGNLLSSTAMATIFLDPDLRIRWFTPAARELLHLIPADVGRPISDFAQRFDGGDLSMAARGVLSRLVPSESQVRSQEDHSYIRRIRPYRTRGERIEGVVVTFIDVTSLESARRDLVTRAAQQRSVAELARAALGGEDLDRLLHEAARLLCDTLGTGYCSVLELSPEGDALRLRAGVGWSKGTVGSATWTAGTRSLARHTLRSRTPVVVEDHRRERRFKTPRLLTDHGVVSSMTSAIPCQRGVFGILGAHADKEHVFSEDELIFHQAVANMMSVAIQRRAAEARIKALNEELEHGIEERTRYLKLLHEVTVIANESASVEEAIQRSLDRICSLTGWPTGHAYLLHGEGKDVLIDTGIWSKKSPGKFGALVKASQDTQFRKGEGFIGKVAKRGKPRWIPDIRRDSSFLRGGRRRSLGVTSAFAFPVLAGRRVAGVLECFSISGASPDPTLLETLAQCGVQLGRVVERSQLDRRINETILQEQQRIGEEIHDSLGQQVTGIAMMARSVQKRLKSKAPRDADTAAALVTAIEETKLQLRAISRGLRPVEGDASALMNALRDLAERTSRMHGVSCRFRCERPVLVGDNLAATHLFRIAQEAIHNAVKHANAKRIAVELKDHHGQVTLEIRNDGKPWKGDRRETAGMGLTIMRHRARLIGADLEIRAAGDRGARLTCTMKRGMTNGG